MPCTFCFQEGRLKYDFVARPGADISQIKMRYEGIDKLEQLPSGELLVKTPVQDITEGKPYTYNPETHTELNSAYRVQGNTISFVVPERKPQEPVVIDPTVTWSTYFNNGSSSDTWTRPSFDNTGGFFNTAYTYYTTFPVLNAGSGQYFDSSKDGITDLVVVRFTPNYSLAWATYYGGDGGDYVAGYTDFGKALAVDDNNNVYFAGQTDGTTFPTYNPGGGAFYQDQTRIFSETSFVVKLDINGVRQWASIFQHENANTMSSSIRINGIATNNNRLYFTGQTYRFNSNNIPLRTLAGAYNNALWRGPQDVFLGRFDANNALEWATYLNDGGSVNSSYRQGADLTFDNNGNMWFVGRHTSNAANAGHYLLNAGGGAYYQGFNNGDQDLIITKFNASMNPVHSTYYGGNDQDIPSNIAANSAGDVAISLRAARSTNFPVFTPGGGAYYQPTKAYISSFDSDAAIIKLSSTGIRQWATYYGGTAGPSLFSGVGFDSSDRLYVFGSTQANNFPLQSSVGSYFDATMDGSGDVVFLRFSNMGVREWATYYGGSGYESLYSAKGVVYNTGCSTKLLTMPQSGSTTNFPTVNPGGGAFFEATALTANVNTIVLMEEQAGATSTAPTSANASLASICSGGTTTLSVDGGSLGSGASWVWYSGSCGGLLLGTGATLSVSPAATTTYYVRAEGSCDTTACQSVMVTVHQPVQATAAATPADVCEGSTINLSASSGSSYSWTGPDGFTSTSQTPVIGNAAAAMAGTYSVTVTDANGCTTAAAVTVSLLATPAATATASGPVCSNGTLTLSATGGTSYSWTGPNNFSSLQQSPQIANATTAASGIYSAFVTSAQGCTGLATATAAVQATQTLAGAYTINQQQPASATNFTSFEALAQALSTSCGISGPVTVEVAAGTGPYAGQLLLGAISGSSSTNTLTINGNGNEISFCAADPNNRDIIRLDGTDNITINGLTLNATCGYGWGVHLLGDIENVTISNNTINLSMPWSNFIGNMQGIIAAGSFTNPASPSGTVNGLTLLGNTINNGYHGIRINGHSAANRAMGVVIEGNTLNNASQYGIFLLNAQNPALLTNSVSMRTSGFERSFGMAVLHTEGGITIARNRVINAGETGMWLHGVNYGSTARGMVANNMIGGGFRNTTANALVLNFSNQLDVYYNSTNADAAAGAGAVLGGNGVNAINNSFAYSGNGAGYAVKAAKQDWLLSMDYNNYYSNGSKFVYFGGADRASLADMQAAPGPLNHNLNSMDLNPMYVSATDLHLMAASPLIGQGTAVAGVTVDFNNQARTSPTDIGADQWSSGTRTAAAAGEHKMLVYPNPFANELTVELSGAAGQVQLVLTDIAGRQIYSSSFTAAEGNTRATVRVADNLPQGVYLLQLRQLDVVSQHRVVKQ